MAAAVARAAAARGRWLTGRADCAPTSVACSMNSAALATARQPLDGADQAMGEAQRSLQDDNFGDASEQQSRALDELRKGAQAMTEQTAAAGRPRPARLAR